MLKVNPFPSAQLPFRPEIHPFESGRGYVLRTAESLNYYTPALLTNMIGVTISGIDEDEAVERLAYLMRQPPAILRAHFLRRVANPSYYSDREFFGHRIGLRLLNFLRPRLCPSCLLTNPICLGSWELFLVTACPIHSCKLIDRCPSCRKHLSWNRRKVGACRCGFDLSSASASDAAPYELAVARLIYRAMEANSSHVVNWESLSFPKEVLSLPLSSLMRFVEYIGSSFHPSAEPAKRLRCRKGNIDRISELVETAGLLLSEWPQRYFERLQSAKDMCRTDHILGARLEDAFGGFYTNSFKCLPEPEFNFLRASFEEFLGEEWDGVLRGPHRWFGTQVQEKRHWISVDETRKLIPGLGRKNLKKLVVDGTLTNSGFEGIVLNSNSKNLWFAREVVETWAAECEKWIGCNEVQKILGLNKTAVMELKRAGLLKFQEGGVVAIRSNFNFLRHDVESIANAFEAHNVPSLPNDKVAKDQISLRGALTSFLSRGQGLPDVVREVLQGRLAPVAKEASCAGVRGYIFPISELREFGRPKGRRKREGLLNIQDAARYLTVTGNVITALVREGFLSKTAKYMSGGGRLVSVGALDVFKEQYIFTRHIAGQIGSNPSWVNSFLKKKGVEVFAVKSYSHSSTMFCLKGAVATVSFPSRQPARTARRMHKANAELPLS